MNASIRTQRILVWWAFSFASLFGTAWIFLLHMVPLPSALLTPAQVAEFYASHAGDIKVGAMIAGWTSGYMVPLAVVIGIQMQLLERDFPIWTIVQLLGGAMLTIFLVLPPVFWGAIAYHPNRLIDATALMNDVSNLTLSTTDQYYMFQFIPMAVVALTGDQRYDSAFPRWYGYMTILGTLLLEVGPFAFLVRSGPFAWNGLMVFWVPFGVYFAWLTITVVMILRALRRQEAANMAR